MHQIKKMERKKIFRSVVVSIPLLRHCFVMLWKVLMWYLNTEGADGKTGRKPLVSQIWHQLKVQILHITIASHAGIHYNTHSVICFCFPPAQGPWQLSNILFVCYCTAAVPRSRV